MDVQFLGKTGSITGDAFPIYRALASLLNSRRLSNASPGIGRLLVGNFFSRRFIVLIELLLSFLLFRRQRFFLFVPRGHFRHERVLREGASLVPPEPYWGRFEHRLCAVSPLKLLINRDQCGAGHKTHHRKTPREFRHNRPFLGVASPDGC
jgi:hypothetical protein